MSVVLLGSGSVGYPRTDGDRVVIDWFDRDLVAVTDSGVVFFRDDDGKIHVDTVDAIQVEVDDAEVSPFVVPARSGNCPKCHDSDELVSTMVPPRCPTCGRRP